MQATCKRFVELAAQRDIPLAQTGFTLRLEETTIPRQVGLAGSSAIVTATLNALIEHYRVTDVAFPLPLRPSFVLSVETAELGINAGLQDRVIQVYEGCMYMDFAPELIYARGYGEYERLPTNRLPRLWLAFDKDPSNSGKIHADVKARWQRGDRDVHDAMRRIASLADEARTAILDSDYARLAAAMRENFKLRRQTYTDACLGEKNLQMVEIADALGFAAKFSGSGGAVVGICESEADWDRLEAAYASAGFAFERLRPHGPS